MESTSGPSATCTACGHTNREGARYCEACGRPLAGRAAASRPGERRQLAVMFCDLVGSTALSESLDPEDWHEVLRGFQSVVSARVEEYGGHVAQYLGDGTLVYFGFPVAHEDDTARALRAGLEIVSDLPELNARHRSSLRHPLQVRIAVHAGVVVLGTLGSGTRLEHLALGDTVNVASRLLGIAEPDAVVVSKAGWHLASEKFYFEDLGAKSLRGVKDAVEAYRVLGARDAEARVARTPLVGRDREMAELLSHFEAASQGRGGSVLVSGEPGIGKSRLAAGLREALAGSGAACVEWHCSSYHEGTALHPVRVALEQLLGLRPDDPPEVVAGRLEVLLADERGAEPERVVLMASLLARPLPAGYPPPPEGELLRRRMLDALCDSVLRSAARRPLLLVVEDLHWADPSTLELLGRLVAASAGARLLLLLTHRPHFAPPWQDPALREIALAPLTRWQCGSLVDAIAAGRPLPEGLRDQLMERTDGIPLFVEELTRSLLGSDALRSEGAAPLEIPSTLRGLLMARLDALGEARTLLQRASVLGRVFERDLLEAVVDARGLESALRTGIASGLIRAEPDRGRETFAFHHALIQEAAYESQLRGERRAVHERTARALSERFPERSREEPEVVARHFEAADLWREAVQYYRRAGQHALSRSAHQEAMRHLSRGLDLVSRIPEEPERASLELGLLVAMGPAISALRGFGHAEIESTQRRAYELSQRVGAGPDLYQAYGALYLFYGPRAELETGSSLATGLIDLGRENGELFVEGMGEVFLGLMEFYRGHFEAARLHAQRMIALEARAVAVPDWYAYDMQPDVIARYCGSNALALLGRCEEARRMCDDMIERGRASGRAFNRGFALVFAGLAFHTCGDVERVAACGEEALEACAEHGFPIIEGLATALAGWGAAHRGEAARGVAQVQAGLVIGSAARSLIEGPRVLGLLAEARRCAGDLRGAKHALGGGLAIAERLGNVFWNAELERLAAEITLDLDAAGRDEAERWLRLALGRARAQGSSLLADRVLESAARYRIDSLSEEP